MELEGGGRLRGAPCSPSTCLRAAPSCTELACKFKCEAQPPIIIISLYCQRCRGGALARREEGSQPQPEPPSQSQRSRSCWERERPQSPPARGSATPPTNAHRPPRGVPRAALGGPGPPEPPSTPPGTPGRLPALGGFSPAERGTRVREVHCSPIKQLTGKRMGRPPPLCLPKPVAMGKVAGTEIPFFPPLCLPDLSGGCNERICW